MAQSEEYVTSDLRIVTSTPTLAIEITKKINLKKKQIKIGLSLGKKPHSPEHTNSPEPCHGHLHRAVGREPLLPSCGAGQATGYRRDHCAHRVL